MSTWKTDAQRVIFDATQDLAGKATATYLLHHTSPCLAWREQEMI